MCASEWLTVLVSHRDLGSNKLTGPIPSTIEQLAELEALCVVVQRGVVPHMFSANARRALFKNELTGSIPSTIGKLTRLAGLYVAVSYVHTQC